jgi:hypothetical protein
VKRKSQIVTEEGAEPLTDDETATWERLLGKAAGDEGLFERKRRDAQAKANIAALTEQRRLANLPKRPLCAEPGSVSLPEYVCHSWLVDYGALQGDWTLMDVGLLVAILGAFSNDEASVFVNGAFDGEGDERTLVVPAGIGSGVRMHGQIAGEPSDPESSGFIRVRSALKVLARNRWFEVEQTVGELRIRLGERARRLNDQDS